MKHDIDTVSAFSAVPIGSLWHDRAGKLLSPGGLVMVLAHLLDTDESCLTVEWDRDGMYEGAMYVSTILRYLVRL